jgi:hypothetical protein
MPLFWMQYRQLSRIIFLYSSLMKRSIQFITAKVTKYSLSLSWNLYLRLKGFLLLIYDFKCKAQVRFAAKARLHTCAK